MTFGGRGPPPGADREDVVGERRCRRVRQGATICARGGSRVFIDAV